MTELSLPKEMVIIRLKSWKAVFTAWTVEQVANLLESRSFIAIDWFWFNRFEVETFEKYCPDDIEMYILSQWDKLVQDRLWWIYNERKNKNLSINWVEHLMTIYRNRYEN